MRAGHGERIPANRRRVCVCVGGGKWGLGVGAVQALEATQLVWGARCAPCKWAPQAACLPRPLPCQAGLCRPSLDWTARTTSDKTAGHPQPCVRASALVASRRQAPTSAHVAGTMQLTHHGFLCKGTVQVPPHPGIHAQGSSNKPSGPVCACTHPPSRWTGRWWR